MSVDKLLETFPDYLARCSVPRVTIHDLLERRETAPLVETETWWQGGTQSLLLIGGVGTGKTVAACAMLRHNWRELSVYMHQPGDMPPEHRWRSGVFVDVADLSRQKIWDDAAQMVAHQAKNAELAILDDTGREMGDGAQALEHLFMARFSNGKRTIITANLTPDAVKERLGARVVDRIQGNGKIINCGKLSLRMADPDIAHAQGIPEQSFDIRLARQTRAERTTSCESRHESSIRSGPRGCRTDCRASPICLPIGEGDAMNRAKQGLYTVRELANLVGWEKPRMARLLATNGVRFVRTGPQGRRLVYVSELEAAMPELMDSIRFRRGDDDE